MRSASAACASSPITPDRWSARECSPKSPQCRSNPTIPPFPASHTAVCGVFKKRLRFGSTFHDARRVAFSFAPPFLPGAHSPRSGESEPRISVDHDQNRRAAQAISNAITKLQRDHYGRGPESVRTVVGYDHIICFLENTFMPVEHTLIEAGEIAAVRETRLAFQRAMEQRFVATVEEISNRKVRSFLSQVSLNPDIAVEVFVLERDNAQPAPEGLA